MSTPAVLSGSELGEGSGSAIWTNVNLPMQLLWAATKDECLQFKDVAKVDSFVCGDDPAGEALWMLNEGKLQLWGDPSMCLKTDDTDEPKLGTCATVAEHDKWEIPEQGGAYNNLKSSFRKKCLQPSLGVGPRKVQLVDCSLDTAKWKNDPAQGGKGLCTLRWLQDADGKILYSQVPQKRSCYVSTGTSVGVWGNEIVLQSELQDAFTTKAGRLVNRTIGTALNQVADALACGKKCREETEECRAFNYNQGLRACELLSATVEGSPPMQFDQEETSWSYHAAKLTTVGTKCKSNCLPMQTSRLGYPRTGVKFGDSNGILPHLIAARFDATVFGGVSNADHAACHANVDAITIEVETYCQAAKTVLCTPSATDPQDKEKCEIKKDSVCRRMIVMPTTLFSTEKASFRTKCGQ